MDEILPDSYSFDATTGVWSRPGRPPFEYSDGDESERYLLAAMGEENDRSCASDTLPGRIRDWPSEYHLSPHRYNLLRPLSITPATRVLEIGAGCGALTRWLGETGARVLALEGSARRAAITAARCRDLPNVTVCAEDFQHFEAAREFDLVTLIGVLEYAPVIFGGDDPVGRCLRMARERLAPDGTLVLAIENRLGLKYFNGCSEDHTGRAFDSINDLYEPGTCRTFGRRELARRLRREGFTRIDGLYPFPDYKLPRCIVSDAALAEEGLDVGQIIAQYPSRDYTGKGFRLFNEGLAWRSVAANGLVADLASSFLLLAGASGAAPVDRDWLLSVFSTDRRACFRTQTRFARARDGRVAVHKERLHPERTPSAGPLRFRDGAAQPYVAGERLIDGLPALSFHPEAYPRYIAYLSRYAASLRARAGGEADGPLPGDLVDCIPPNLVQGGDGELHFIDAEWVCEREVTLPFMVFRAIVHDMARVGVFGTRFLFDGCADMRAFVRRVLGDLGIDASSTAVDGWIRLEGALLAQVNVPRAGGGRHFTELLREQLASPPARLLPVVLDPSELEKVLRDHYFGRSPFTPPPGPA
jgi:SAM-dependent methyltransferase